MAFPQGGQDCTYNNCQLDFQDDGNFVIYVNGAVAWNTATGGRGWYLYFNNQSPYMTIYDVRSFNAIWQAY